MANIELRCPKCRNNFLYFNCYLSHNVKPSNPKKEDWNFFKAKRYRIMNKVLEVFSDGNWKECNNRGMGLSFNGNYRFIYYLCKCGFFSENEYDFINNDPISQIEEKVYENGRKYIGQFKNGKREGYGIMFFPDGGRYEGNWDNDLANGKGIEYYRNGDRYEGEYFKDEEDGEGVYYYNNGDRIIGNYKNGKKIGKHVKLCSNGEIEVFNFDN